jgi:hypothetical protein
VYTNYERVYKYCGPLHKNKMDKKINNSKGEKGFHKKYPNLGEMVIMRVPIGFKDTLNEILPLCDTAIKNNKEEYEGRVKMFKQVLRMIEPKKKDAGNLYYN